MVAPHAVLTRVAQRCTASWRFKPCNFSLAGSTFDFRFISYLHLSLLVCNDQCIGYARTCSDPFTQIIRAMRLLNTKTFELSRLFVPSEVPDYVILSHRWRDGEVTFGDIARCPLTDEEGSTRSMRGFLKIQGACKLARDDGYEWIWVDSCCIDKSSSAELQETINAMWRYYSEANYCYAYMDDVANSLPGFEIPFGRSEWFKRGWTLQEMIAPKRLDFYAANWQLIGTKLEMCQTVSAITHISADALRHSRHIQSFNAAEKLSWVSHRRVTREEDESYSLLGLFGINMPLLYGEGRQKAFIRLQEAIYRETSDTSLFFFRTTAPEGDHPLLADSPGRFCSQTDCSSLDSSWTPCSWYNLTSLPQWRPPRWTSPPALVITKFSWARQTHNQIMIKRSQDRLFASVELQAFALQDISHQLLYLDDSTPAQRIDQVALLEYTLDTHPDGALCMLLCRDHDPVSPFWIRGKQELALLQDIRHVWPSMKKVTIVSPVLENKPFVPQIQTNIQFRSLDYQYHLDCWKTHGLFIDSHDDHCLHLSSNFQRDQVDCYVHKYYEGLSKLCIEIIQVEEEWCIKNVLASVLDKTRLVSDAKVACCDLERYADRSAFPISTDDGQGHLHPSGSKISDRYIFSDDHHGTLEICIRRRPALQSNPTFLYRTHNYELRIRGIRKNVSMREL
jgi:hypothetical protein